MDKQEGARDKLSIQIQTSFEFEWLTNQVYPKIGAQEWVWDAFYVGENLREVASREFKWVQGSWVSQGI